MLLLLPLFPPLVLFPVELLGVVVVVVVVDGVVFSAEALFPVLATVVGVVIFALVL